MVLSRVWLKSKITKPAYPTTLVKRMRLYDKLANWQEKRAVVVGAPSGYGKSTLISHWIDIAGLHERAAWLSLDEGDADPHEFMSQMAAAVDTVVPGVLEAIQPILEDTHGDANRAMRRLLATLEAEEDLLLVLDDLQRVDSPQIHALLMTVLELGPPSFHLILIARSHLQLPLARLFAHGVLTVLGTEDLRFTQDEIRTYLAGTGYPSVTQDDLARLAEECEGWVAALQMSVLSAPEGSEVADLVASLTGGSDWVAHYLAEEVLKRQSEEMRRFLLQTSLLDAFDAHLAAAVTGIDNVDALLADLVRSGLFLIGLDQEHGWYRYHHLFQDLLRERLKTEDDAETVAELHSRAAHWLARRGNVYAAVQHLLAARDLDAACTLVADTAQEIMLQDPYQARRLLNLLPTAQLTRQPRLILERCRLTFLFDEGDLEQYVAQADTALSAMPVADVEYPRLQAEYLVYRGAALFRRQSYAEMAETLAQALTSVHLLDDFMAASLYFLHMHLSFAQGSETEAIKMGEQALSTHTRARFGAGVVSLQREMVKWAMRRGNIAEANRRLQEMYGDRAYDGSMSLREYALTYLYAAENSYWQDDLATARDYQQAMLSLAQTLQDDQLICMGQFLARAYANDLHEHEDAWLALTSFSPVFVVRSLRAQAIDVAIRSLVAINCQEKAWQLALELGLLSETPHPQQSERVLTAYCLAYLSRGDDLAALTPLLEDALANRRQTGHRVGELQLLAIIAWQQLQLRGELAATAVLVEADKLAQQTGYMRVLRNIPVLTPLLARVRALGDGAGSPLGESVSITEQEQHVLALLDADHTYPEIAEKLVISINTVRTHVRNLYRKLGVHRRAQALETARDLGLLPRN